MTGANSRRMVAADPVHRFWVLTVGIAAAISRRYRLVGFQRYRAAMKRRGKYGSDFGAVEAARTRSGFRRERSRRLRGICIPWRIEALQIRLAPARRGDIRG